MRIRNWNKFQHYKERRPAWIKLYHDLLDDRSWHELDAENAKFLVSLWLLGSEDEGKLPDIKEISFRLRVSEKVVSNAIAGLSEWLEQDASDSLENPEQVARPETEKETEKEKTCASSEARFDEFWQCYPKKRSKGDALKAWRAIKPTSEQVSRIIAAVTRAKTSEDWLKKGGQFVPYPGTWLRAQGWEDVLPSSGITPLDPERVRQAAEWAQQKMDEEYERRQRLKVVS